jgi:hypothetical protein
MLEYNSVMPKGVYTFIPPTKTTRSRLPQRADEKNWATRELDGFRPKESDLWKYLTARDLRISKNSLVSLGRICALVLNIPLTREYKRRANTMMKWFQDHWAQIQPWLDHERLIIDSHPPSDS